MSEGRFQTDVKEYLKSIGAWHINIHGNEMQTGAPDILFCYKGKFIALELKSPTGSGSALQKKRLREIQEAGGIAEIVYSLSRIKSIIACIDSGEKWTNGDY